MTSQEFRSTLKSITGIGSVITTLSLVVGEFVTDRRGKRSYDAHRLNSKADVDANVSLIGKADTNFRVSAPADNQPACVVARAIADRMLSSAYPEGYAVMESSYKTPANRTIAQFTVGVAQTASDDLLAD